MIYNCEHETANGYTIEVQFWSGAKIKKHWPFPDAEEIKKDWGGEDFEDKLKNALRAVSQFVIDFGIPRDGMVIDDNMGYCQVVFTSVNPLQKTIRVAVYAEL